MFAEESLVFSIVRFPLIPVLAEASNSLNLVADVNPLIPKNKSKSLNSTLTLVCKFLFSKVFTFNLIVPQSI